MSEPPAGPRVPGPRDGEPRGLEPRQRLTGVKGVTYATFFRAWGGSREKGFAEDDPAGIYQFSDPERLPPPPGYETGPGAFYSQSSLGGLGQVRFEGEVPLAILIERLNGTLGIVDERGNLVDFRRAYPQWEFTYRVVEFINGKNPEDVQCLTASNNQKIRSCLGER